MEFASLMKCPHCGREYSARACRPLIPSHEIHGPLVNMRCPGSGQTPRNAASDKRILWKDETATSHN